MVSCLTLTYWLSEQWEKMEHSVRRELQLAHERQSTDDLRLANLLERLGLSCHRQDKLAEADESLAEAMMRCERWYQSTISARRFRKPSTARTRQSLRHSRNFTTARILCEHAKVRRDLGFEQAA